jgi:SHS2 domain-containing protein
MTKDFEYLEHTADLQFMSYGSTLGECFRNAARAMFSTIVAPETIDDKITRKIELHEKDLQTLLHNWLAELLFLFESDLVVFNDFDLKVEWDNGYNLEAVAKGDEIYHNKHQIETDIKAVTYHDMRIEKKDGVWTAKVLCDI